jgi:hypothetical protein
VANYAEPGIRLWLQKEFALGGDQCLLSVQKIRIKLGGKNEQSGKMKQRIRWGNGKRPECILVPDLFGYMVGAFRKNMDMGQAKQQHSPS